MITCALISGGMYFFMVLQIIAVMSEGVVSNLTFPTFLLTEQSVTESFFNGLKFSLQCFGLSPFFPTRTAFICFSARACRCFSSSKR